MSENKKLDIKFAPGVLDEMETMMSPEELQEFLTELQSKVDDGTLFEDSTVLDLDQLEHDDPETYAKIVQQLDAVEGQLPPTLH